ncbi:MAG: DEAD/DEAH box helicase [Saprospiraceae bacterium]|nr:DEAD/DEAH box helicase [Saprospiraceae bacterium]
MAQYGRTWWGEQWLKSLDRIDFSNRLPRGRSYANGGKVKNITISENVIQAKVRGSRPRPYDINIVVPPFTDKEKKALLSNIKTNPLILSQLLNRQLPHELLAIAEKNKIKIFAQSWQDIKLNCSCPDFAVPCKHLAAVIYLIANEIDQNPFIVFSLHRLNLLAELDPHQTQFHQLEEEKIFSIQDCIAAPSGKAKTVASQALLNKLPKEIPDFSLIEDLRSTLPLLFTANPLFYTDGDFKSILQTQYKRLSRNEPDYLAKLKNKPEILSPDYRYYQFFIHFKPDGVARISAIDTNKKQIKIDFYDLVNLLSKTEKKHLDNYSPSFILLYRAFRCCNILCERGAILPRLFLSGPIEYHIQWIPALVNSSVKSVIDVLMQWLPPEMVIFDILVKKSKKPTKPPPSRPEEGLYMICSLFINASVKDSYSGYKRNEKNLNIRDEKLIELFFDDTIHEFDGFFEKEIPNTIQLWLSRFTLNKKAYSPVLQVHEHKNNGGFELEVLIKDNGAILQPVESLSAFLNKEKLKQFEVLKAVQLLAHYMPGLNSIIESEGTKRLQYSAHTFADVLTEILPAIKMFGIQILLPKSLQEILYPKVTVALKPKVRNKSFLSLTDLIDFEWKVAVGNHFIGKEEFMELSVQTSRLVKIRDQYVLMNKEEIDRIIKKLTAPTTPGAFMLLQAALSGDFENAPVQIDKSLQQRINDILKMDAVNLPKGLDAVLRPYQERGFSWMYKNTQLGLGSLLADDMGLGKTIQVITTIQKFKEEGFLKNKPVLVVAPTTLLSNWQKECSKFAPSLSTTVFHGPNRKTDFNKFDVVITTYGMARTQNEKLCKQKWHVLVIDEAQNIKNTETAQTKAIKKITAHTKIAMSGTPVENRLLEYWSIFDFANPGYLGNANWFNDEYSKPIEINQDKKRLEKFRKITAPFILRRVKTDKNIINDLPDKIENNQYCYLSKEQASLYKSATTELLNAVEQADGIDRRGLILKLLTVLKQICNHPANYLKKNDNLQPDQSGKMMMLLQLLDSIYENNEKVLIFSQYREMGDILRQVIHTHCGKKALQLHGGNSRKERDEMVQAFQINAINDTFILSLKAGGTGLNLTAGSHVIHYDLWWNPAVEAQATDRAFRIGQTKNVMVHRMITKGTLEEKIDDMLKSKKHLANITVMNGEKWIGELSDREIRELVSLKD